jgi:hypothetical protein
MMGALSTGLGHQGISEIFSLLDVKTMKKESFRKYELYLGEKLVELAEKSTLKYI